MITDQKQTTQVTSPATEKRHTHSTIAGLEDLSAVLIDLHLALQRLTVFINALQGEIDMIQDRTDIATDIANLLRVGPNAYPKEGNIRDHTYKMKRRNRT